MVYGVVKTFQAALKYRGGWRGLLEHMYTVSVCVCVFFSSSSLLGIVSISFCLCHTLNILFFLPFFFPRMVIIPSSLVPTWALMQQVTDTMKIV